MKHSVDRMRCLMRNDDGDARLYDARFFGGDFFNRITEIFGVFEFDRRNAAEFRRDDVCRVEPPAQSDFEYVPIGARTAKAQKRVECRKFEPRKGARDFFFVFGRLHCMHQFRCSVTVDGIVEKAAGCRDAFAEIAHVRRSVEADGKAGFLQNACDHL